MPFDALNPSDLVIDEIQQLKETGHDTEVLEAVLRRADHLSRVEAYDVLARADAVAQDPSWPYREPTSLDEISAVLPGASDHQPSLTSYEDRILGAWTGRVLGCMLGKPIEDGIAWTSDRIHEYLVLADALPLDDFIPALDPMPPGFEFRPNWPQTTRGNVHGSARDDDIDYTILNLEMLEQHGSGFTTEDVAEAWLARLPIMQVYTAERAAYRNLVEGVPPSRAATVHNPYREWIGAQIRADVFGYICPGRPRAAAVMAHRDAVLSHVGNGVYAEMWAAALIAMAFRADDPTECLEESLRHIPASSRLHEALTGVLDLHRRRATWDDCLKDVQARFGHYPWVHAVNNSCLVAAGLLWGDGDFMTTIALTVQGGWDTDSNGATAGSFMGALRGSGAIPARMSGAVGDQVRSAVFGFEHSSLADLARRTATMGRAASG
jgi:ADP-ribosylglycohydrolase